MSSSQIQEPENIEGENIEEQPKTDVVLSLQLGDVIRIQNSSNDILNDQTFIIEYIDKNKIKLVNTEELTTTQLKINEDGTLGDGTIEKISLIYRNDKEGYARQNNLLPGTWINIYFGGDMPVILTGEITNLEEDMIELTTTDKDVLYINFGYKGIPEDIPIETIEIREKPSSTSLEKEPAVNENIEQNAPIDQSDTTPEMPDIYQSEEEEDEDTDDLVYNIPKEDIKNNIKEFIIRADEIQFGKELAPITQMINVDETQQRYSVDTQTNDLLDEMLSTIPNLERTTSVLNNIHIMIERFKQLRGKFSVTDEYGNVTGSLVKDASWKPLAHDLKDMKTLLYWLLPVAKNIRKVYDISTKEDIDYPDVVPLSISDNVEEMSNIIKNFKSNVVPDEQNRYVTLINDLNPYFTPFNDVNPEDLADIINETEVVSDLNVIIDNLGDFYSSVVENDVVKTKRFVIERYNLGLTRLNATQLTGNKMVAQRVRLTQPDTLSLKSFITLPEPALKFSHINLPGTNIMEKANLNNTFLSYWKLLKDKARINNVQVENVDNEIEFDEDKFLNNIKNFVLTKTEDMEGVSQIELYKKFLQVIVPKTKVLFNLIRKYIKGKLSLVEVVGFLEPFLIYTDDLTYMQYKDINKFLQDKISEFNKNFVDRSKQFLLIKTLKNLSTPVKASDVSSLAGEEFMEVIKDSYDMDKVGVTDKYSSQLNGISKSEFLSRITSVDQGNLFNDACSIQNIILMLPDSVGEALMEENDDLKKDKLMYLRENKCVNYNIAKQYQTLHELQEDNGKTILFDKKYDKTQYSLLDDFEKEKSKMTPDEFYEFLTNKLKSKFKYSETDAPYMAETLITGVKKVLDGDYAILYSLDNNKIEYYKRSNNEWELDNEVDPNIQGDDNSMMCILQKDCLEIDKKYKAECESNDLNKHTMKTKALEEMLNEFDKNYQISKEKLEEKLKSVYEYHKSIMDSLLLIERNRTFKYNDQKFKIGATAGDDDKDIVISPFIRLRDKILGQSDFIKRHNDIIRFSLRFTREAFSEPLSNGELENIHWRYCIETGTQILPAFLYSIAATFVNDPDNYSNNIERLVKEIGAISDDGDSWVDKNSGYVIRMIDFDIDEGYEEGFKVNTKSVMEADAGDAILNPTTTAIKYNTPETKMISKVVDSLANSMGINIEHSKEFIIQITTTALKDALPSEKTYKAKIEEMAKKGKAIASYKEVTNMSILYLTMGSFLIAIQTSIPSIKTRKTYPGCVRSFLGYPFEGSGDLSGLVYLSCIAYKTRSANIEPWNVLVKSKETTIADKLKVFIDTYLLPNSEVVRKFQEKTEFLLANPNDDIPHEHELNRWTTFLPPLKAFKINNLTNISEEFKSQLLRDLKSGSKNQKDKILILKSKVILFSLAIQERIQKVVNKKNALLKNSSNEPFLENACCNDSNIEGTIKYFEKEENEITLFNTIVKNLENIIDDINAVTKAPFLFSKENTKNIYPPLTDEFNEETIYRAFIKMCKFNSLKPIRGELLAICSDKPEFLSANDSISEKIKKLKQDGRNYTNENLLRLLQIINRRNVINLSIETESPSQVQIIREILEKMQDDDYEVVPKSLRENIDNILDTFDIAVKEDTDEMRKLKNYLGRVNVEMKNDIYDFLNKNGELSKRDLKNVKEVISNFMLWHTIETKRGERNTISDDITYNSINFIKDYIRNIVTIFPNIILNKVDNSSIEIPKYWGLSVKHTGDIKGLVNEYYLKLRKFYDDKIIKRVLGNIQPICDDLLSLVEGTPYLSEIKYKNSKTYSIFDKRTSLMLFENYFLQILLEYIKLADDDTMIILEELETPGGDDNGLTTTDELEDNEQRIVPNVENVVEMRGNKKILKKQIAKLIETYLSILQDHKDIIDLSYDKIMDVVFKTREKEKDTFTDRLKALTDEERNLDTILKINKLGVWSKGLQKGLTSYVKENYDDERQEMENLASLEKKIRKNVNVTDENVNQYLEDYLEEQDMADEIEQEEYNMGNFTEDYMDGDYEGQEEENWGDYN
jgi:hypothetical protein